MAQEFIDACKRYEARRQAAREATHILMHNKAAGMEAPPEFQRCDLTRITDAAIAEAAGWTLPWQKIAGQCRPYVRRFELALWYDGQLYGLAAGRASRGKTNVCIHYLERRLDDNPFAGWFAAVVADAAENYAKLLGCQSVRLRNPTDAAVRRHRILGFSLAESIGGATYYERGMS